MATNRKYIDLELLRKHDVDWTALQEHLEAEGFSWSSKSRDITNTRILSIAWARYHWLDLNVPACKTVAYNKGGQNLTMEMLNKYRIHKTKQTKKKETKKMPKNDLLSQGFKPLVNEIIEEKFKGVDVESIIHSKLGDIVSKNTKLVQVELPTEEISAPQIVHKQFEELLKIMAIPGLNTLLTGGAGLAKSTAVAQAAEALKQELASISFSNQTTKTDLIGFIDANGKYRKSGFIDAFEKGKIFLADEMDACSSNVLVLLNSAISNGFIETPDNKVIKAHPKFRFVGTANTNLRGASGGYTARNKLDSATIDRFVVIEWELDENLEKILTANDGWLDIVKKCRKVAAKSLEGFEVTPRSSLTGAKLLRAGVDIDKVIKMTIVKSVGVDEEKLLRDAITKTMKDEAVKVATPDYKK